MLCPNCRELLKGSICACGYQGKEVITHKLTLPRDHGIAEEKNPLATAPHVCKKCGYDFAEIYSKGIFYSDEDENFIFICGKCGHQEEAEGSKIK
jgi:hypothetical protein